MMHRIQGWTGLRAAVIALGLVAWTATGATAAPLSYTTSGQVDTTTGVSSSSGGTADNVVSFVPLSSGNSVDLSTGQTNASLGNFVISPLADGTTTTYSNTPIQISFLPASYGSTSLSGDAPVVVSGVLNGVVNGPSSSTVTATLNPPPNGLFSLGSGNGTAQFSIPTSTLLLAPSTSNSGTTTAQGLVTSSESTVPEPSTIALFLTTVGGLGLRRYVLSRRRSARV
ncbi:MAG: PEP-CTERM sorting domain-containing protein [Isosphaeraceae bacterium]